MTTAQFIAKQHVKYYWKVVKNGDFKREPTDHGIESKEAFWQYEPMQREV